VNDEQKLVATAVICNECERHYIIGGQSPNPDFCGMCGSTSTEVIYLTPNDDKSVNPLDIINYIEERCESLRSEEIVSELRERFIIK
jgi:hypothetical protein